MSTDLQTVASNRKLQLESALPDWCALKWHHALVCASFCFIFLLTSYLPVSGQWTWSDVCAGQYSTRGELAAILPLSDGMRNQVIGLGGKKLVSFIFGIWGESGISIAFACLQIVNLTLWFCVFARICPRWPAIVSVGWIFSACFFELTGLNTMMFGHLCAALFFLTLLESKTGVVKLLEWSEARPFHWIAVFLLFVLWVNVDVSFVLGLVFLICFAISRVYELRRGKGLFDFAFIKDREFQNRIWLLEWAIIATLFNPDGVSLWKAICWWPDNPLIHAFGSNSGAYMFSWTGLIVAFGWLPIVSRSRRSNHLSVALLLIASTMTFLVAFSPRMIFWFAVATAMLTLNDVCQSRLDWGTKKDVDLSQSDSLRFAFTLACGLIIWVTFCLTPVGNSLLGGKSRSKSQIIGRNLPIGTLQFLNSQAQPGLHVCPINWGNWLQSSTPVSLMCTSDTHKVPAIVIHDCNAICNGVSEWRKIADKYAITGIIVDKKRNRKLLRHLRRRPGEWRIAFEDKLSMVYRREL